MSLNDPMPKGGYRAVLEIVKILGEDGDQQIKDLVPKLEKFGYRISEVDDGEEFSKALSPGGHTYLEITEVLRFAGASGSDDDQLETELTLTEDEENDFGIDTSGQSVYSILTDDELDSETKRGAVGALILSRLSESDIQTSSTSIPHAFRTFITKVWDKQDEGTGRYQTNWNLEEILTDPEISGDWNKQKLRYCRQRAVDLGICHKGNGSGNKDLLYPVLAEDIFQAVIYYVNRYYKVFHSDSTPNMNEFYENLIKWYPIDRDFFGRNILYDGLLYEGSEITKQNYSVLYSLLNMDSDDGQDYQIIWLEGEGGWDDNIPFAEFEIGVK